MRRRIFRVALLIGVLVALSIAVLAVKEIPILGLDREGTGPLGLTLGLDLEGGSHLKYQADLPHEIDVSFETEEGEEPVLAVDVLTALVVKGHIEAEIKVSEDNRFTIQLRDVAEEEEEELRAALAEVAPVSAFEVRRLKPTDDDMKGAVNTIKRRIGSLGTREPIVQRFGSDKVIVQLPGVKDVDAAKALIRTTAQLVVVERTCTNEACTAVPGNEVQIGDGLTGDDLNDAYATRDSAGLPAIGIAFNSHGRSLFSDLTQRIVNDTGKRIVWYLDGQERLAASFHCLASCVAKQFACLVEPPA